MSFAAIFSLTQIKAAEWPEHLILHEDTQSPDGHYGIVVPENEDEPHSPFDYFADLQTHRLLGEIKSFDYVENQHHGSLTAEWSPDSTLCVAIQRSRFGFDSAVVLEPKGGSFTQTDLGAHIHKSIDGVIVKQSRGAEKFCNVSPWFRLERDRTIHVYGVGHTWTKQRLEGERTYEALFHGVFDLRSKKWTASAARPLSALEADMLDRASSGYSDDELVVSPDEFKELNGDVEEPFLSNGKNFFRSEETKLKYLDDHLNDVYKALRLLLPPAQFSKIKEEQIAWLKERDALPSVAEKSRLTAERSETLQHLVWNDHQQ